MNYVMTDVTMLQCDLLLLPCAMDSQRAACIKRGLLSAAHILDMLKLPLPLRTADPLDKVKHM
jgi:hypothetical protein